MFDITTFQHLLFNIPDKIIISTVGSHKEEEETIILLG